MKYKTHIAELQKIFEANNNDRHTCHQLARPILLQMAADIEVLHEIIRSNLTDGHYWSNKKSTVIDLEIENNPVFSLRAHCFMPLPDRQPLISHQSIHHHGNLFLTTAAVFGKKYTSILFKKAITENPDGSFQLQVEKVYEFEKGGIEFISNNQPHIVFIPETLFITYALWSTDKNYELHKLKSNFLVRKFKQPLKWLMEKIGLARLMGINSVEGFDFYPKDGKIRQLKDRNEIPFPRPKQNYIQNLFYILQQVQFNDIAFLRSLENKIPVDDFAAMLPFIDQLEHNEPIADSYVAEHIGLANVNIPYADIMACFT